MLPVLPCVFVTNAKRLRWGRMRAAGGRRRERMANAQRQLAAMARVARTTDSRTSNLTASRASLTAAKSVVTSEVATTVGVPATRTPTKEVAASASRNTACRLVTSVAAASAVATVMLTTTELVSRATSTSEGPHELSRRWPAPTSPAKSAKRPPINATSSSV